MEPLPGTLFGLNPDYLAVLRGLPGQAAKLWPSSTSLELALLRVLFVVAVAWMIRAYVLAPTIRYVKTMWRQLIVLSGLLSYLFLQVWLRPTPTLFASCLLSVVLGAVVALWLTHRFVMPAKQVNQLKWSPDPSVQLVMLMDKISKLESNYQSVVSRLRIAEATLQGSAMVQAIKREPEPEPEEVVGMEEEPVVFVEAGQPQTVEAGQPTTDEGRVQRRFVARETCPSCGVKCVLKSHDCWVQKKQLTCFRCGEKNHLAVVCTSQPRGMGVNFRPLPNLADVEKELTRLTKMKERLEATAPSHRAQVDMVVLELAEEIKRRTAIVPVDF